MPLLTCSKCGGMFSDKLSSCPNCGNPVSSKNESNTRKNGAQQYADPPQPSMHHPSEPEKPYNPIIDDRPSIVLNAISFLSPLVGWILYFSKRKKTPIKASSCSKWAWISFAISVATLYLSQK